MSASSVKVFQAPLPWTVTTSLVVHAAVALALLLRMQNAEGPVPVGIEMLYLGEAKAPVAKTLSRRDVPAREKSAVAEAPAEVPTQVPAQTGLAGEKDGAVVSAIERYKFELRLFLESRKIYPETARRLRQTGRVVVHFKVGTAGDLTDIRIEQPAGSEILNRAALELVQGAPRFKPIPAETEARELQLSLPIEYIL